VRADLAESFSFVFIPLVWWGFFELVDRPRLNALIGAGLAYAGLVLTATRGCCSSRRRWASSWR